MRRWNLGQRPLQGGGPGRVKRRESGEWTIMPKMPIKFRCVQCNQLLGVSPSKVGSVVSCPRCAVELIVPEADDPPEVPRAPEPEPIPAILSSLVLDRRDPLDELRPEDIRVEPGLPDPGRARRQPRPTEPAPAPSPEPPDPEPPPLVLTPEALAGPPIERRRGPTRRSCRRSRPSPWRSGRRGRRPGAVTSPCPARSSRPGRSSCSWRWGWPSRRACWRGISSAVSADHCEEGCTVVESTGWPIWANPQ